MSEHISPEPIELHRYQWSKLPPLTLGRYGEHWATLRFIECGLEVYSTEVDDRSIDCLVRYAPGRCLEVQVKAVRKRNITFIEKKHLGSTNKEVRQRLCSGYCVAFFLFEDGREPDMYLLPGYAWLTPGACFVDHMQGNTSVGPNLEIRPSKKYQSTLDQFRFTPSLLAQIIQEIGK